MDILILPFGRVDKRIVEELCLDLAKLFG